MVMIVCEHTIFHGLGIENLSTTEISSNSMKVFFQCFFIIAVDVFVFISGYYGIKFKFRGFLNITFQVLCYSILFLLVSLLINKQPSSIYFLLGSFFPVSMSQYWFISIYLALYVISPFLNKGIEVFDKKMILVLIAILFYFNSFSGFLFGTYSQSGYSIFNFIVIYLLGRMVMKYDLTIKNIRLNIFFYVLFYLAILLPLIIGAYIGHPMPLYKWWAYNNPLLIMAAIFFFFIFKNLNVPNSKFINLVAGQVLGVYIIHDNPLIRQYFIQSISYLKAYLGDSPLLFVLSMVLFILSLYIICSLIELVRKKITERPFEYLYSKLRCFFFKWKFVQKLKLNN